MKNICAIVILLLFFSCVNTYSGYAQATTAPKEITTKTYDVNKDGKPDVTYYSDGKYVAKAEADTNYDGKPDVTVFTKDGKFESAQVDTDYNGTADKQINDVKEFNKWLNRNHPDFNDRLNKDDWRFDLADF